MEGSQDEDDAKRCQSCHRRAVCFVTAQPCGALEAAPHRLGGCWHRCSPPGCVVLYHYVCVSLRLGGSEDSGSISRVKNKKKLFYKILPFISPRSFRFFLMPIITLLTTIAVSRSKPIYYVVWIQISSAPAHSWYCCFAEHRCTHVISPPSVEMLKKKKKKRNILHTVCLP